jgi:hypothetical protein
MEAPEETALVTRGHMKIVIQQDRGHPLDSNENSGPEDKNGLANVQDQYFGARP